ncbi:hypothetical protein QUF74_02805 [Candidatus Halobeggiatoa sp. HSG11]|nr:hypothetical protein [Candidatus Halobeggiatoa sp. HSG11]
MLNIFKTKPLIQQPLVTNKLAVKQLCHPDIDFDELSTGIDNVHIDVHISPHFIKLTDDLITDLLTERSSSKRRFNDKPSKMVCGKLDDFNSSYSQILKATIHNAKENKQVNHIQLFQVTVIKFILETVQSNLVILLQNLRAKASKNNSIKLELSERITWINQNKNSLLCQVTSEVFAQLLWVEMSPINKLRESLLGLGWTIPKEVLVNPLLQSPSTHDHEMMMNNYILIPQTSDDNYNFKKLDILIDGLLEHIATTHQIKINIAETNQFTNDTICFSWQDVPANMEELFATEITQQAQELEDESSEKYTNIALKLQSQQQATKLLEQGLQQSKIILNILAAYETPNLYKFYFKLIKPDLIYQALCGEIDDEIVAKKLQNQLRIRTLRYSDNKPISINKLKQTKKHLQQIVRKPDQQVLRRFIIDFIAYRRDLKYRYLINDVTEKINLLTNEADVQLSRSNNMLYEYFEPGEHKNSIESIRCHVILKADLRGSTTMTDELFRRGLNPATHFSRNFFNPISELVEIFGAEKVFIEGDAVILSIFEYHKLPDQWSAVARACGLAAHMLQVVNKQNEVSRKYDLPELELGIGICYLSESPKFLYDGKQRIMISPAIGTADRLSSCSWKLRKKYANQPDLLTNVMVFQQAPDDAFKGEKGMTTFRYNLNGVELGPEAFKKLQNEMALRQIKIRLPDDDYKTSFHAGYYPDVRGNSHEVIIREGQVKIWQEEHENYPMTDIKYYEVVTNKKIINTIKKLGF